MENYRVWLQNEYTERCKRNERYSVRAFATLLEVDSSSLSQILSGKRNVSSKLIAKFCDKLGAPPQQKQELLNTPTPSQKTDYHLMSMDAFAVMADWYHVAILELINVDGFQHSPRWIAQQLNITASEALIAIDRLKRLDLIEEKSGKYIKTQAFLTNYDQEMTSAAHKKLQRHLLEKALYAIDDCKSEEKDITTITMAADMSKMPEARDRIKKFRRELAIFLEDGKQTRVLNLGIQLYPLSKERK